MFASSFDRWRVAWLAAVAVCLTAWPSVALCGPKATVSGCLSRQHYTAWERDCTFIDTWKCYYFYAVDPAQCQYKCQVCYWHNTEGYRHWVYYYNPKNGQFWGKCATPSNPQFVADRPVWARSWDNGSS